MRKPANIQRKSESKLTKDFNKNPCFFFSPRLSVDIQGRRHKGPTHKDAVGAMTEKNPEALSDGQEGDDLMSCLHGSLNDVIRVCWVQCFLCMAS